MHRSYCLQPNQIPNLNYLSFFMLYVCVGPKWTSMSFSIPMGHCHVPTRSTTISPSIGSIKLDPMWQIGGQQSNVAIQFLSTTILYIWRKPMSHPYAQSCIYKVYPLIRNAKNPVMQKRIWAWVLLVEKS